MILYYCLKKQKKIYNKKERLSKKSVHFDKLKEVKMANDKKEDVNADKIYGHLSIKETKGIFLLTYFIESRPFGAAFLFSFC